MSQQLEQKTQSLLEIPISEWTFLCDLYADRKCETMSYSLISHFLKWVQFEPNLDIKCLSLDESWRKDGTFLIIGALGNKQKDVYFDTLSDNMDRLSQLLECFTIDPKDIMLFGYSKRVVPAAERYIRKFPNTPFTTIATVLYRASPDIIAGFSTDPPAGLELRRLAIEDAETVNALWPHRTEGSVNFVKRLITHHLSVGAYDANGRMVSWCLREPIGRVGMLQVQESQKRLGLGSLMVRYISKKIMEQGEEVLAAVVLENVASSKMFEKLGFKQIDNVYWTYY
ncbi:uncharacterized protein LOC108607818 [Drosophila busckii]|uniref:uncharacterized protein LOC108607818 n=1 Tax=Drosophila busckii TaxID=30019 RepID=UPI00083F2BFD|nr:uncharacterized protein LOC108607818 [Drosophila busckii]